MHRGQKTHPKSRNTKKTPRSRELFRKVRANFCLLPCNASQEPDGNCSEKLVQMNFFILGGVFSGGFSSSECICCRITECNGEQYSRGSPKVGLKIPPGTQPIHKYFLNNRFLFSRGIAPQKYFPVFVRVRIQAPHVFAPKLIPQEMFPACIGSLRGGMLAVAKHISGNHPPDGHGRKDPWS